MMSPSRAGAVTVESTFRFLFQHKRATDECDSTEVRWDPHKFDHQTLAISPYLWKPMARREFCLSELRRLCFDVTISPAGIIPRNKSGRCVNR
jgi:hypothetical protein